ncbi:hypothetical protein BCR35DRAFT_41281 [Leucosporidium creatinivorum]|uniref:Uncharacterized protein n=1 Tax=Leucosporidium creatinivorum TaxID=106004 RepID=A0A1Y2C5Y0_9BASI|nr:hypothetical protein BCR35DRAFT_41281 [Leucosporidium creatinivorum]
MSSTSTPFSFSAPATPSLSSTSASPSSSPFSPLLTSSLPHASSLPALLLLADALYAARVELEVKKEMATLSGSLRDEWKVRVGAVKASWMARWIPELELEDDEGEEDEGATDAKVTPLLPPTIISDADGTAAMSSQVDASVEREFGARILEAEGRVRSAVSSKERMEMELLIGCAILEAQQEHDSPNDVALEVLAVLINACDEVGVEAREVLADRPLVQEEEDVEGVRKELGESNLE